MLLISTFLSSFVLADENNEGQLKLVALGDSITFGTGLEPGDEPFPSLIGDGQLEVTNLGVPGATSTDLVNSLGSFSAHLQDADVVTLTIGGNDLLQNEMMATILNTQEIHVTNEELAAEVQAIVATYTQNLQTIIAAIRAQTDAPIVLYTIYNPFGPSEDPFAQALHGLGEQVMTAMNTAIHAVSGPSGSLVANAYASFSTQQATLISADRIHPNANGHQILAALADQLLADLLVPPAPPEEEEPVEEEEDPVEEDPNEEPPSEVPPTESSILVALGDSITYGLYLDADVTKPSTLAFPHLIEAGKHEVINLGVPGLTSAQLLQLLQTNEEYLTAVQQASIITVNIGNNDLLQAAGIAEAIENGEPIIIDEELQNKLDGAVLEMAQNLQAIMGMIRQQSDAPVVLYNLYNPFGENEDPFLQSLHLLGEELIPAINSQIIHPIANQSAAVVADAYTAFSGKQSVYITYDFVHPNALGHEALAAAGVAALRGVEPEQPIIVHPPEEEEVEEPEESEEENEVIITPVKKETTKKEPPKKQPVKQTTTDKKQTSEQTGKKLPNTATQTYTYMAIGAALLVLGAILLIIQYRRQRGIENLLS